MAPHRRLEREFGVPFPGEILPEERWTRTAVKRLPAEGRLCWPEVFGRQAHVILDLGCGNGRSAITSAILRPDCDHLGLDILPVVIRYATRRANQRGLSNIRFAVGEGRDLIERLVEPGSVSEVHVYHPQPFYDPAQIHRRLITPRFLALVHRTLAASGQFFLQTDNPGYWRYMLQVVPCFFDFTPRERTWPDAPKGRTRREIIALRRGLQIFRGQGTPLAGLDPAAAERLAEELPPPTFDADRRLQELDKLEREPDC